MKHLNSFLLLLATTWTASAQESCPNLFDSNSNGAVDIEDFLAVLSLFSDVDSDSDGIWDSQDACTDLEACNYAASPTEPCAFIDVLGACGGGCEGDGDGDGICDDEDDCVGVVDECGVCNGPGPTEIVIEDIVTYYDSVYLPFDDAWYVYPVDADTTFGFTCAPAFETCGDMVSYQGYDYTTVQIGERCWFAENLRSELYLNGDSIPAGLSDSEWQNTSSGAVAVYGEGSSDCYDSSPDGDACDEAWSLSEYGRLYNFFAIDDARGLCPSGWHVPSETWTTGEWMTMEMALGMSESEANEIFWRGTNEGSQMKTDYGWNEGGNGTNSSGFSGLPGGQRFHTGSFGGGGTSGTWWSSPTNGSDAWNRLLTHDNEGVHRVPISLYQDPHYGFSVRCIQDTE